MVSPVARIYRSPETPPDNPGVTEEPASPVILAQDTGAAEKHDAGLRGDEFSNAVLGLTAVFALGLAVLGFVVFKGRRKN